MSRDHTGRRIGQGHLRVDAERAIEKLRAYQLDDPYRYLTEIARAAVIAKGSAIAVWWDTDDVWLAWHDGALDLEGVRGIFDALVSPEASSRSQPWQRRLAVGVNTALGLSPRYVDVYIGDDAGSCVRFTPKNLDAQSGGTRGTLRENHPRAFSEFLGDGRGSAVHVRRSFSAELVGRFFTRSEPPEVGKLRAAASRPRVDVVLGEELIPAGGTPPLLELPLGKGQAKFVVTERGWTAATLAECGFDLDTSSWLLLDEPARAPLPLGLYVDIDSLPTNAARSRVRTGAPQIAQIAQLVERGTPEVFRQWAAAIEAGDEGLRVAALRYIAAFAAGLNWKNDLRLVVEVAAPLLKASLAKNAFGELVSLTSLSQSPVHVESTPLEPRLAPLLRDLLWAPSASAERLLFAGTTPISADARIHEAEGQLLARRRFMARSVYESTRVAPHGEPWCSFVIDGTPWPLASDAPSEVFAGVRGEVVVQVGGFGGRVVLLHERRHLQTLTTDTPVRFDAVLEVTGLVPNADFTAALDNGAPERAERAALAGALRAVEGAAWRVTGAEPPRSAQTERGASSWGELCIACLTLAERVAGKAVDELKGPLRTAPLIRVRQRSAEGGGQFLQVSLREFAQLPRLIAVPREMSFIPPGFTGIVSSNPTRLEHATGLRIPSYDAGGPTSPALVRGAVQRDAVASLDFPEELVAIAWTPNNVRLRYHRSMLLDSSAAPPKRISRTIAYEDAFALERQLNLPHAGAEPDFDGLEDRLVVAMIEHASGVSIPGLEVNAPYERHLLLAAAAGSLPTPTRRALEALPLVAMHRGPPQTLETLKREGFTYSELPPPDDMDANPVHADGELKTAIETLTGRIGVSLSAQLEQHKARGLRQQLLQEHRDGLRLLMPPVDKDSVSVAHPELLEGHVALRGLRQRERFEIRLHGRHLTRIERPKSLMVDAVLDVDDRGLDDTLQPTEAAIRTWMDAVHIALIRLLSKILDEHPVRFVHDARVVSALEALLVEHDNPGAGELLKQLRALPVWTSPSGESVAMQDALTVSGRVRIVWQRKPWLAGDAPSFLDRAAISLPSNAQGERQQTLIALAAERGWQDATIEAEEEQTRRRAASGKLAHPELGTPRALTRRFDELPHEVSLLGEISLIGAADSHVELLSGGLSVASFDLTVPVPVRAVMDSPRWVAKVDGQESRARRLLGPLLERASMDLLRNLLHEEADPHLLVRRRALSSWLRGDLSDDEIGEVAILPTNSGEWVPLHVLPLHVPLEEREGDIWVSQSRVPPVDPKRLVFALSPHEQALLSARCPHVIDATERLLSDSLALQRRRRGADPYPQPSAALRRAIAMTTVRSPTVQMTVAWLAPEDATEAAIHWSSGEHHFPPALNPLSWPLFAQVHADALRPSEDWSAPQDDNSYRTTLAELERVALALRTDTLGAPPNDALAVVHHHDGWSALQPHWHASGDVRLLPSLRQPACPHPIVGAWARAEVCDAISLERYGKLIEELPLPLDQDALAHAVVAVARGWKPTTGLLRTTWLPTSPRVTLGDVAEAVAGETTMDRILRCAEEGPVADALRAELPTTWVAAAESQTRVADVLRQALANVGVHAHIGDHAQVKTRGPLHVTVDGPSMLVVDLKHPLIVALEASLIARTPRHKSGVALLAVHALSLLERHYSLGANNVRTAITKLLSSLP